MKNPTGDMENLSAGQMADCARAAYKAAKLAADDEAALAALEHWRAALKKALKSHDTIAVGNIAAGIKGAIPKDTTVRQERDFRELAVEAYEQNLRSMQPGLPGGSAGTSIFARLAGEANGLKNGLGKLTAGTRVLKAGRAMSVRGDNARRRGPDLGGLGATG